LIGISPQGHISFISSGWGGHTSDLKLTEESGVLENLLPGDIISADRGFTIHEVVAQKFASAHERGEATSSSKS